MAGPDNFGLSDDAFFADPVALPRAPVPPDGIALGAPARIDVTKRETLPLVAKRASSAKDAALVPFGTHAVLHLVDVERNLYFCGKAVDTDNEVPEEFSEEDLEAMEGARTAQPFVLEGRARTDVPWRAAKLLARVTLRDQASNVRTIALQGPKAKDEREPLLPSLELSTKQEEGSPEVPASPGIALAVERIVVLGGGAKCVIKGACRLPVLPADNGVVGVHLVLVDADDGTPVFRTARLPVTPDGAAFFSVDLLKWLALPEAAGTYFLSAFCRDLAAGPFPITLVTRELLPPGAKG